MVARNWAKLENGVLRAMTEEESAAARRNLESCEVVDIPGESDRKLTISSNGQYDFPFDVDMVDEDGIYVRTIAQFRHHIDAILFVEAVKMVQDVEDAKRRLAKL